MKKITKEIQKKQKWQWQTQKFNTQE
jgi:hypothetical protein